jgi:hypothetical protein
MGFKAGQFQQMGQHRLVLPQGDLAQGIQQFAGVPGGFSRTHVGGGNCGTGDGALEDGSHKEIAINWAFTITRYRPDLQLMVSFYG